MQKREFSMSAWQELADRGGNTSEVFPRSASRSSFPGLWVFLRRVTPSRGGFQLRRMVFAYANRRGDIAELDMLVPSHPVTTLPCAREIGACLQKIENSEHEGPLKLYGRLPAPRQVDVTVEGDPSDSSVFVRLAEDEPTAFCYDTLGDGSEVVEYTYDGRILGLRVEVSCEGSGILVRKKVMPRYRKMRAELRRLGFRLNGSRPYLEDIDFNVGASSRLGGGCIVGLGVEGRR